MATLEKTMFRDYDIRGKTDGKELTPDSVSTIAKAYGTLLQQHGITEAIIGHDFRPASEWILAAACNGLQATGINLINLGMIITPMMYSAQYHHQIEGGMMITASHNPVGWSGFKLALGYSNTLGSKEIKTLYQLTQSEAFNTGQGTIQHQDYFEAYQQDLLKRITLKQPLKVVVNSGNGTPGPIFPPILRQAGCEVIELYTNLDPTFPHYTPNPAKIEMMQDTAQAVLDNGADIGFAIDGDGDRLGVIAEDGQIIWPDRYLILLARQILAQTPGAKIIYEVNCSSALAEDIEAHGGIPIEWKTGHAFIKKKLHEEKASLGGELSGHIFINKPDYYGFDDAVFVALKLLEYLTNQTQPLSKIIAQTPAYVSSPIFNIDCADEDKHPVVNSLIKDFEADGHRVSTIAGAKVYFTDAKGNANGWGIVRPSSNLPKLSLRFEAKSEASINQYQAYFKEKFTTYPQIGHIWRSG